MATTWKSEFTIAKNLYKEHGNALTKAEVDKVATEEGVDKRLLNRRYKLVIDLVEHHGMVLEKKAEKKDDGSE